MSYNRLLIDGYGQISASYLAYLDAVIFHSCPTCGADPQFRCTTTSGRELSITHSHKPRITGANASYQPVPVRDGYFDGMPS